MVAYGGYAFELSEARTEHIYESSFPQNSETSTLEACAPQT